MSGKYTLSFECNYIISDKLLLFYEFALATDQDIFKKRGAETLSFPHNRTSVQHLASANLEYPNCNYN
jgi:hypothetical protein